MKKILVVLGLLCTSVFANEELNAKVLGSGDITYKGNPTKENFKTFGSGDISKY